MKKSKSPSANPLCASLNQVLADSYALIGEVNDPKSHDLMIGHITLHQKTAWMLRSFLK